VPSINTTRPFPAADFSAYGYDAPTVSPIETLVQNKLPALNRYQKFACTDVGSFPGNIKGSISDAERAIILDRPRNMTIDQLRADKQSQMKANLPHMTQKDVGKVYTFLEQSRAGCCSTFAFATAHILTQGARDPGKTSPRVEVLACQYGHAGTHCFTVVGRAEGSDISNPATWGKDVRIVDGWLGSLGHDTVFTVESYPYPYFLRANDRRYDSHQPDPADVEFDPMAFLRNRQ